MIDCCNLVFVLQVDSIGETSIIMYALTQLLRIVLILALLSLVATTAGAALGHDPLALRSFASKLSGAEL
jgi:hypothetical protein